MSHFINAAPKKTKEEMLEFEESSAKAVMGKDRIVVWYNATLTCHHENFCGSVYYKEEDTFENDKLVYVDLHCTHTKELQHSVMVLLEGQDGVAFDNQYEPMISVVHDCGETTTLTHVEFDLPPVPDVHKARSIHVDYNKDLTGLGDVQYSRRAYLSLHREWRFPLNEFTKDWSDLKNMSSYPELYEPKVLYWDKHFEDDKKYCMCFKSIEKGAPDRKCELYSTVPSIFDNDNWWKGMMVGSFGKQKRSAEDPKL